MRYLNCRKCCVVEKKRCVFIPEDYVLTLLEYWYELYRTKFRVAYEYGKQTETERYELVKVFYEAMGRNFEKCKKIFHEFLNNTAFDWVSQRSLNWVCKSSNFVFILPNIAASTKANKRPNWTDSRGVHQTIVPV